MRVIWKKLKKNRKGFSLAETLIAILILLMVSAIIGGAIPAASNAFTKTVDVANAQVVLSTAMTALRDELGMASIKSVNGTTIVYKGKYGWSKLEFGTFGTVKGIQVTYGGAEVYDSTNNVYKIDFSDCENDPTKQYLLVSDRAITSNLKLECVGATEVAPIEYSGGVLTFTGLQVSKGDTSLAKRDSFKISTLKLSAAS